MKKTPINVSPALRQAVDALGAKLCHSWSAWSCASTKTIGRSGICGRKGFRDHGAPAKLQLATGHEQRAQRHRADTENLQGKAKGDELAIAARELKRARDLESEVKKQTGILLNSARTASVAQAQQGLAILDRLPNVDVRRWQP